jgi:ubiquinol-cytochrome c reductase cytochrome b subunit
MRLHNKVQLFSVVNSHLISYPTPMNLNYSWNWGSLAGLMLASQLVTGILLAMHYVGHVDYAFASVQHIMTDVPSGIVLRYAHANGASLFFIVVYVHILRGFYYGSGAQPRELVWITGVVILLVMIITAFIGYVLPWGLTGPKCSVILCTAVVGSKRQKPTFHHGPHNIDVISLLFGTLLGDTYAEKRSNSTRFSFKQSSRHVEYLMWFHSFLADRGYCNPAKPTMKTVLGKGGKVHYYYRINTYSSASFNWIHQVFYPNGIKIVPQNIATYLTPFALAVWIMDDGGVRNNGMMLSTYCFSREDNVLLCSVLWELYGLKCTIHTKTEEPSIYVWPETMDKLRFIVLPYIIPSMRYKVMGHSRNVI